MNKTLVLAAFAVVGLASAARADLAKANWFTVAPPPTSLQNPSPVSPFDEHLLRFVDNQFGINVSGNPVAGTQYVVDFFFSHPGEPGGVNRPGDTTFDIYAGASEANVTVTKLEYFNEASGFAAGSATATGIPGTTTLVPGRNRFIPTGFTPVSGFQVGNYNAVRVTFVFPTGTVADRLQIDMVSNPEPATIALFGLGALGLGAMVRRRRNALKTPVKS